MSVTSFFPTLVVQDQSYDLSHLVAFTYTLYSQGSDEVTIVVRISYKSHVFSVSPKGAELNDFRDENGKGRAFCPDRYSRSKRLPGLCLNMITANDFTWVSMDRNTASSLVVTDDPFMAGHKYAIYYYLFPSSLDGVDVELVVKSAYSKSIDTRRIRRRYNVRQKIKECYFKKKVVP